MIFFICENFGTQTLQINTDFHGFFSIFFMNFLKDSDDKNGCSIHHSPFIIHHS